MRTKYQYYYKPVIMSPDDFSMEAMGALRTKLRRDYLGFFGNLYGLYGKSERKKELVYIINKIRLAIVLLDNILVTGKVRRVDVEKLLSHIDEINESRDVFLREVQEVSSLRKRVEKTIDVTGVTLQDLNVTRDIVKEGLAIAARARTRRGIPSFLKRTMPDVYGRVGGLLTAAKVAAFGPFTPLADIIGAATKGIFGLIRGLRHRTYERGEEKAIRGLSPVAYGEAFGRSSGDVVRQRPFASILTHGRAATPLLGMDGYTAPLVYFFNRKAYQAKWTKELLDRIKGIGKSGDIGSSIISGWLPKIAAGIAIMAGWKIGELINKLKEMGGVETGLRESEVKVGTKILDLKRRVRQIGLPAAAEEKGMSPERFIQTTAAETVRRQQLARAGAPFETKIPGIGWLIRKAFRYELPKVQPLPEVVRGYEQKFKYESPASKLSKESINKDTAGAVEIMKKLSQSVDRLSDSVRKEREMPNIRDVSLGNIFDSADPLVNSQSAGRLSISKD